MRPSHSVSMQDVARDAGVSPQTVSRVVNGSTAVKSSTTQRVQDSMRRLGYRPNYAARALKHGRFKDIGVLLFHMTSYGNARILNGITGAATNSGYAVTLRTMGQGDTLRTAVDRMKQLPVDGIIVVLEQQVSDYNSFIPASDLPVVLISEEPADHCPTIDADQYGCSIAAVEYLLSKGHRTVHHIAGPSSSLAARSRVRGWRDALAQVGVPIPSVYIGDWNADSGYQAGVTLAHDPTCTAIYAANDQMAYGAMRGVMSTGKKVPEDISIMGVDNSLAGMVPHLNLTTMRMKFDEIGAEAFSMIERQCSDGEHLPCGVKTVIPSELLERQSVRDISE